MAPLAERELSPQAEATANTPRKQRRCEDCSASLVAQPAFGTREDPTPRCVPRGQTSHNRHRYWCGGWCRNG